MPHRSGLVPALRAALDGEVTDDDHTRAMFSRDASMYTMTPLCVAFPVHADDVARAVSVAAEHGVPLLARGAGTSLAGQAVGNGVVLDLSRHLHRIIDIDASARLARVEAGVVQDDLNRAAAAHGLMFAPDTSTANRATIGGMIGNNSAGSGSVRYGMTVDHVRALDVVLADGTRTRIEPVGDIERERRARLPGIEGALYREVPELVRRNASVIADGMPSFWRRAGGYRLDRLVDAASDARPFDLTPLLVGAEGTLAVVIEAMVALVPRPARTVMAVGQFRSSAEAIAATADALALEPAGVELMDRTILDLSRSKLEYAELSTLLDGDPDALLFVSFTGDGAPDRGSDPLAARLETLVDTWRQHGHGYHTLRAVTPAHQEALLKVRRAGLGLLMAAGSGTRRPLAFVEDTAVDPSRLAEYAERFRAIVESHGLTAGFYGHCSVGCLHVRPFLDLTAPGQTETMRAVAEEVRDLVREFGGVNSSEHGDGLARSEFNRELFGNDLYEVMRQVKGVFDPAGTLNPGKIVDAPAMTDHLRDPALRPAPVLRTRLDFEGVGGMRGAADRCMNIGLCRKGSSGVMCPSYMATRDEEASTRGRANALVAALSEPDPHAALGDERLHEVLDLCLMCKACKSECPLGVDMAALKSEALAHRHDVDGTPLRAHIFGSIRMLNRLGSATAPLSNLPGRVVPLRRLAERTIGITSRRRLPTFARDNLVRWHRRRPPLRAAGVPALRTVLFLADSFTTYTEPGVGRAAIELLELAGFRVQLESGSCCGRANISKGLLDDAKAQARHLSARLAATEPDAPVVGCEPSCLLTLRDEHLSLLPGDPAVRDVAGRVRLVEELLVEAVDSGHLRVRDDAPPVGRILFLGHCHQKAEVGTAASVALLRRLPGATVVELDAGCCGMAGSFGFEAEHYDVSMSVGRDRLFPAIDAEPAATLLSATGVSCRQQIEHGTRRRAWHPVELLRQVVAGPP